MASVEPASHYCFLLLVFFVVSASAAQKNISATVGDSVTLPCKAPNNSIRVMWWSRPDQEPKYVLMYRDEQFDPEEQHPFFMNRVDLQDRQMKDGNVSLILRNVMIIDSGTYECHVFMEGPNQRKRTADYISVINLRVAPPVQKSITAGQTVILPCQAPNNSSPKTVVQWSRSDLEPQYVLKYHHNHTELSPSFMNQVDLQDRQMKDGDVSLVLKDVMISDAGTYKCRVSMGGTNRRKRSIMETDPISVINLVVAPPGQPGGSFAVVVGLLVLGTLVLVVGGVIFFLLFKKSKDQKR